MVWRFIHGAQDPVIHAAGIDLHVKPGDVIAAGQPLFTGTSAATLTAAPLTAPITGNLLAKAHMHSRMRKDDLPPTGVTDDWATFDKDGPSQLLSDLDTPKS